MGKEEKNGKSLVPQCEEKEFNAVYDYYIIREKVRKLGSENKIKDFKLPFGLLLLAVVSLISLAVIGIFVNNNNSFRAVKICGVVSFISAGIAVVSIVLLAIFSKRDYYEKKRADNANERKEKVKDIVGNAFNDVSLCKEDIDFLLKKTEGELKELQEKLKVSLIIIFITTLAVSGAAMVKEISSTYLWNSIYNDAVSQRVENEENQEDEAVKEEDGEVDELEEQIENYKKEYEKSLVVTLGTILSFLSLVLFVTASSAIKSFYDVSFFNANRNMEYLLLELMKYSGGKKQSRDDVIEPNESKVLKVDCGIEKIVDVICEQNQILSATNGFKGADRYVNLETISPKIKKQKKILRKILRTVESIDKKMEGRVEDGTENRSFEETKYDIEDNDLYIDRTD